MNALLKDSINVTNQYTAKHAALSSQVAAYFVGDASHTMPLDGPSNKYAEAHTVSHCKVSPCINNTLTEDIVGHIQEVISDEIPALKKEIHEHDAIRTDLESYRRRVKNLQEKGKPGNDPDLIKFSEKLARTQTVYTGLHDKLMAKLRHLHETRHEVMSGDFLTLLASQLAFHQRIANTLSSIAEEIGSSASAVCDTIDGRIEATPYDESKLGGEQHGGIMGRLRGISLSRKKRTSSGAGDTVWRTDESHHLVCVSSCAFEAHLRASRDGYDAYQPCN